MAKTSPRKQGAPAKSEPIKAAVKRAANRPELRPQGDGLDPLPKAPLANAAGGRNPQAPKATMAAPKAAASPAPSKGKGSAPASRRAERRSASEIKTATAPAEPAAPSVPAPANRQAEARNAGESQTAPAGPLAASAAAAPAAISPFASSAAESVQLPTPDVEQLAHNIALAIQQGGKALAAYLRPRESGEIKTTLAEEIGDMVRSIGRVAEYYMADPQRAFQAQTALTKQFIDLWGSTLHRLQGEQPLPVAAPDAADKRFADAAWHDNPYFDFIKQAYVLTTRWADDLVKRADDIHPHERDKAQFYLRQVTAALSPSNFLATNPELLRTTLAESGENLARGLKMLAEDIEAGHGELRIRQADARAFKFGVNMAATPGKVIFRNALIELIQYEPTTPEVYQRPLLIVPPWINKYYVLDLNPEKSFVRWAVGQGLTVFVISWVNPDERCADKNFDSYMREGILAALDCIEQATGEREVATIGYCVGGTLLAATLGYMAAVGDKRITSATFFATQIDFTDPGDLKVFVDAEQLKAVEERMAEHGYLEGSQMANAFNMLRPNELIWSYYVNNYLKGKEPMPFDLLVWNSDSTRMPAANHKFYLRHCYLQNDLSNGRMALSGKTLDLKKVTIPVYELATKEDHIAPARSVFTGAKCFGGPVRYVMAGSGHIAGVVNPPTKPKYQFWSDGPPEGRFEDWVAKAKETPGSWWPDWSEWIVAQAPAKVARKPGDGKLKPLCDAPGDYVRVKA
jgi:poly[(R)-3-hydroxyalkanoate] polymerase subunit PhaC